VYNVLFLVKFYVVSCSQISWLGIFLFIFCCSISYKCGRQSKTSCRDMLNHFIHRYDHKMMQELHFLWTFLNITSLESNISWILNWNKVDICPKFRNTRIFYQKFLAGKFLVLKGLIPYLALPGGCCLCSVGAISVSDQFSLDVTFKFEASTSLANQSLTSNMHKLQLANHTIRLFHQCYICKIQFHWLKPNPGDLMRAPIRIGQMLRIVRTEQEQQPSKIQH